MSENKNVYTNIIVKNLLLFDIWSLTSLLTESHLKIVTYCIKAQKSL